MTEEWFCELLQNLKTKENRLAALTEIRARLTSSENVENIFLERLISAPELYDCLETTVEDGREGSEEVDLASHILSTCMANLTLQAQSDLQRVLQRALNHRQSKIRALALNAILKELQHRQSSPAGAASEELQGSRLELSDELILQILDALRQDESEVGVPAMNILSLTLEDRVEQAPVREELLRMLALNETVKCRVYELAVNLAKRSPVILQKVEFLLDRALSELDNDDLLLQVNILEIFVSLAEQNHGLLYLERRQVFELMAKRVEMMETNPVDRLLVPGIMKFFGKIATVQPEKIIVGYPHMVQCLWECIHSGDTSILPSCFDTLANLARTQQGKKLLNQHYSAELKEVFEDYASYLRNLSSDLKNRAFSTLEVIFTVDGTPSTEISQILRTWFIFLAGSTNLQFLLDFCKNPFPDIKVACLSFIRAVCMFPWGVTALKETAGFVEYLLDRKTEFDKEAKFAKYEVIKLLAASSEFDTQTNLQLQTYINEGPYFVDSILDVAVMGN